ncbi:MAG: hybrid sensor histidine kinase/response regulator [Candidatus Gastranaerophilaceae bacterium]
MPEIIKSTDSRENYLNDNLNRKFLFVEDISCIKKLKPEVELCIIQTDFGKSDLKCIQKLRGTSKNTEIWICSDNLSRKNIASANKIGIKTVISSPVDKKMVEEFFNNKYNFFTDRTPAAEYDYSIIANSKIMIIDDNTMNIELLEEILSEFNIEISSFSKPKEAFEAILHDKFDLFLLDVMMPGMSGFELAKKIKDTPHNKNVPVIFISALSDSRTKIKGYDLGSFAYIEKPFDINIIKSQIFNVLKAQKIQEISLALKEDFLATIAHDLKTPISAGINALGLLLNENLGELEKDQQEIIEDLLDSTKFMQEMVGNILCRDKIDKSKITLSKQIYSIKKLVEHCIDLTKYILKPQKQHIQFKCSTKDIFLPLDFVEMKRAMHNLIANASEHSPLGGKILIEIFNVGDNNIGLFVQDFGRGIDLKHQNDVFSQYMSFTKKHKRVGSGLGLYITKNIVEAHGGEILLESKVGYGTKITIILPAYIKE